MRITELGLAGVFILDPDPIVDERGLFARTFDRDLLGAHGLQSEIVQMSIAWNERTGTLRGMHLQLPPSAEVKFVRCTRGSIHDVLVDLRPGSPTFGQSLSVVLDEEARRTLYVPECFAHGYQVLRDRTEVAYAMTAEHAPQLAAGLRHDDPALGLPWPLPVTSISQRDLEWPSFEQFALDISDSGRGEGTASPG